MHEHVFAGLRGDEAVALVGVEPFHGSNRHVLVPPSTVSEDRPTPTRTLTRRQGASSTCRLRDKTGTSAGRTVMGYGHRPPPPSTTTRVSEHAHEDEAGLCPRSFASGWAASPAGDDRALSSYSQLALSGCCRRPTWICTRPPPGCGWGPATKHGGA